MFGLAIAFVVAIVAAGCGSTRTVTETTTVTTTATATETTTATSPSGLGPPAESVQFGHIQSLTRKGDHFEMRFDPAWFLSGETANIAAAEDGAVEAGQPVPNDNYVVEEGHRLLTYLVPDDAHVTVLTKDGDAAQLSRSPGATRSVRSRPRKSALSHNGPTTSQTCSSMSARLRTGTIGCQA